MAETHINPVPGSTVVFHQPGAVPLHPGAGQPVVATAKTSGSPNSVAHGQINAGGPIPGPIFHSPA